MTDSVATIAVQIEALADRWRRQRDERLSRRHLDRTDFEALAATGFGRLIVPESHGGLWRSTNETGPAIVGAVRTLAEGDPSVALVASMHPSVVSFWTAPGEAPEPYREAWADQRAEVFATVLDGHLWGTVSSEPGSGGDVMTTKTKAIPDGPGSARYRLEGQKHFGSGSEVLSFMITTARLGDQLPQGFYLDLRNQPWDGTAGLAITHRWDGMGMKATQSHAVRLDGIEATALAWPEALGLGAPTVAALGLPMFSAVTTAIVDETMAEAARRLGDRPLRAFEEAEWARAQVDHWLLIQAMDGLSRSLATKPVTELAADAVKAKIAMADLAEALVSRVCRVIGGGAFSARSPFASWYEDVRALGYLRPPWGLAYDQLIEARRSGSQPGFGIDTP